MHHAASSLQDANPIISGNQYCNMFACSPPLMVRKFEMTVGFVSTKTRPCMVRLTNRPQRSWYIATKLDEIGWVDSEMLKINQRTWIWGKIPHSLFIYFIYYNLMTQEKMYAIWIICKRVQDPIQGKSPKWLKLVAIFSGWNWTSADKVPA